MTSRPHISHKVALLLFSSLLFALRIAAADPIASADDFFHGGAMSYLSNNIPAALDIVTNGLQQFPNDEKLKKLERLLKQQQQQNQQQDQQKDKSQQSKQDDKQKEQEKKDQQKADEQKAKEMQDQQKRGQQPKPDEQKDSGEQQQAAAAQQGEQMTPEQAMRVLDTTKGDEKVLPVQMVKPPPSDKKLKDW